MSESSQYQVVVEDAGPARKRITVTVPSDVVDAQLSNQMATISGNVNLPGFRKGKVPRSVIEKRFGDAARDETRTELVREGLKEAIESHNLEMLQQPEPTEDSVPVIESGTDFSFTVEMDVVPEFDLPDFAGIEIIRPTLEVEKEHLDEEIERQCLRNGKGETLEDGFLPGDRLLGRATCTRKGEDESFFTNEQTLIVLPDAGERGEVLGLMIDDVNAIFASRSVGDVVPITIDVPEHYEREDIRGKTVNVEFQVHVAERIEPCSIEELVEAYQLPSADVLREQVQLALEQRRDEEQSIVLRDQAREKVVEQMTVPIPENLSAAQVSNHLDRVRLGLLERGEDEQAIETKVAEAREDTEKMANDGIKLMFLHQRLIKQYNINVNEQEVNQQIVKLAMNRGVRPDELRSRLAQNNQLGQIGTQLLENKAADAMAQQMKIVDMDAEQWKKLQGDMAPAADGKTTKKKTASKKKSSSKKTKKKTSSS
ncbi:MAG: trigger factor [Phycisphaerales bacterium]|nr:trigger factor [Phycisphaerales bacterium]